jgi:hypothetical protein
LGELEKVKENGKQYYCSDMLNYCESYAAHVVGLYNESVAIYGPEESMIDVELKVSMENWAPSCWGTSDAVICSPGAIHIIDFKYGQGVPVNAFKNSQMMLYALGAYNSMGVFFPGIKDVIMEIYQPRINNFSEYRISLDELLAFGTAIKKIAKEAYEGAQIFSPGSHCRWCKIGAQCRYRADKALACKGKKPAAEMGFEEIATLLPEVDFIKKWAEDLWAYAEAALLAGQPIAGYKMVHGRSSRTMDENKVIEALENNGVEKNKYLSEPKLLPITQLEKSIGKKTFTTIAGGYITKTEGPLKMAPESDKRAGVSREQEAISELLG